MGFLDDYEPVEDRLRKFWADYPDGRILTFLEERDAGRYIVRTEVYTDRDDARPRATGWAEERASNSGVNSTSAAENCETSSIGRALANLGYAAKGKRPSREEMRKSSDAARPTGGKAAASGSTSGATADQSGNTESDSIHDPEKVRPAAAPDTSDVAADEPSAGSMTAASGETSEPGVSAAAALGKGPAAPPVSAHLKNHIHEWVPSPKLSKWMNCAVPGCPEMKLKSKLAEEAKV